MKLDPIKLWFSTVARTSKRQIFDIFLCRLEKLRRKSLFVKVQKINGNLKRLSRKILFPLGELPFILIYQTMSSIYVSSKVNICFCLIYYFPVCFCTFFVWFDSDGASRIYGKWYDYDFCSLEFHWRYISSKKLSFFSRSDIVLWAGQTLNSNLFFFAFSFKYSMPEQPAKPMPQFYY